MGRCLLLIMIKVRADGGIVVLANNSHQLPRFRRVELCGPLQFWLCIAAHTAGGINDLLTRTEQ